MQITPIPILMVAYPLFRTRIQTWRAGNLNKPRNRFPAWRAGATALFVVPARQIHRLHGESIPRNRFLGSLNVYKFGLGIVGLKMAVS
jgi:hypothetical protein